MFFSLFYAPFVVILRYDLPIEQFLKFLFTHFEVASLLKVLSSKSDFLSLFLLQSFVLGTVHHRGFEHSAPILFVLLEHLRIAAVTLNELIEGKGIRQI